MVWLAHVVWRKTSLILHKGTYITDVVKYCSVKYEIANVRYRRSLVINNENFRTNVSSSLGFNAYADFVLIIGTVSKISLNNDFIQISQIHQAFSCLPLNQYILPAAINHQQEEYVSVQMWANFLIALGCANIEIH